MKNAQSLVKQGIEALYDKFGPVKTIKFLQELGLRRGNALDEIESITAKLSREDAIRLVKKVK